MNEDTDAPFSGVDPDGDIDEQEQYDESLVDDDELDEDEMNDDETNGLPEGFHIE